MQGGDWDLTGDKTDLNANEDSHSSNENFAEEDDSEQEDYDNSSNEIEDKTPRQKDAVRQYEKTPQEYLADDEEESNSPCDEEDCVDVLDYTKTEDQSGNSLTETQFLAMKDTVLGIQNSVALVADVDYVDDALCDNCGQRTFLPKEFLNSIANPLCDQCLVTESGHSDCEIENCPTCIQLAKEMSERAEISELFAQGLLIYSPGSEEQDLLEETMDTEYIDYDTVESPKVGLSDNKKKRFLLKRDF